MVKANLMLPVERIENRILLIRQQKVMLDSDLAALYGVSTKRLNEQVRRNIERFPEDFMFQLTDKETESLRSQIATSKEGRGGRRYNPYVFTEHGAIMAATVLNSQRAVEMSIYVVRAFVKLRQLLLPYREIAAKFKHLEEKLAIHDGQLIAIVKAIRLLMPPPQTKSKEPFGFHARKTKARANNQRRG